MSEHTPGPWGAEYDDFDECWRVFEDDGHPLRAIVAVMCGHDEDQANAHLIAAAPGMLAALKAMSRSDECCFWCGQWPHSGNCALLWLIAKAEGR